MVSCISDPESLEEQEASNVTHHLYSCNLNFSFHSIDESDSEGYKDQEASNVISNFSFHSIDESDSEGHKDQEASNVTSNFSFHCSSESDSEGHKDEKTVAEDTNEDFVCSGNTCAPRDDERDYLDIEQLETKSELTQDTSVSTAGAFCKESNGVDQRTTISHGTSDKKIIEDLEKRLKVAKKNENRMGAVLTEQEAKHRKKSEEVALTVVKKVTVAGKRNEVAQRKKTEKVTAFVID